MAFDWRVRVLRGRDGRFGRAVHSRRLRTAPHASNRNRRLACCWVSLMTMTCPRCNSEKLYKRRTRGGWRCANPDCRYDFSDTTGTALHSHKKPAEWYAEVIKLYLDGVAPNEIARRLEQYDGTSVYRFLARWRQDQAEASLNEATPACAGVEIMAAKPIAEATASADNAFITCDQFLHPDEDSSGKENIERDLKCVNLIYSLHAPNSRKVIAQSRSIEHCLREATWRGAVIIDGQPDRFSISTQRRPGWGGLFARSDRHGSPWPEAKLTEFSRQWLGGVKMVSLENYFDTSAPNIARMKRKLGLPDRERHKVIEPPPTALANPKRISRVCKRPTIDELWKLAERTQFPTLKFCWRQPRIKLISEMRLVTEVVQTKYEWWTPRIGEGFWWKPKEPWKRKDPLRWCPWLSCNDKRFLRLPEPFDITADRFVWKHLKVPIFSEPRPRWRKPRMICIWSKIKPRNLYTPAIRQLRADPERDELMNYMLSEGMLFHEIALHFKCKTPSVVRRLGATASAFGNERRYRAELSRWSEDWRARKKNLSAKLADAGRTHPFVGRGRKVYTQLPPQAVSQFRKRRIRELDRGRRFPNLEKLLRAD